MLWLRGPMQRMHDVGALFFLFAFPFPSIFRTPLSQKRKHSMQNILFYLNAHKRFPPNQQRRTHLAQPQSLNFARLALAAKSSQKSPR